MIRKINSFFTAEISGAYGKNKHSFRELFRKIYFFFRISGTKILPEQKREKFLSVCKENKNTAIIGIQWDKRDDFMKKSWAYPEIKKGYPRTFSPDKEKRQEESFIPSVSGSYADAAGEENERGKKRKTTTGNKKKKYVSVKKVQERAAGRKKIYPLKKFPVKIFTGDTVTPSTGKYAEKRFPEKAKYRYITLPDRKKKIPPEEKWNREILFFKDGKELFTVPDPGKKGQTAKGKKILKKFFPSVKKRESRFGNILQRGRTNVKINNRKEWKYNGNDLKKRMTKMLWQKSGKDIFLSGRMAEFSGKKFLQPCSSPLSSLSGMVFLVRELEKTRTGPAGDLSDDRIFSLIKHYMDENIPSESV